jgi:hypothetical protein
MNSNPWNNWFEEPVYDNPYWKLRAYAHACVRGYACNSKCVR